MVTAIPSLEKHAMQIQCPFCHRFVDADPLNPGDAVFCPLCNRSFSVSQTTNKKSALASKTKRSGFSGSINYVFRLLAGGLSAFAFFCLPYVFIVSIETAGECLDQHPEDGDRPEVLQAEQALFEDVVRWFGQQTLDAFLAESDWEKQESERARHAPVMWSFLMSREMELQKRIEYLEEAFLWEFSWWMDGKMRNAEWDFKTKALEEAAEANLKREEERLKAIQAYEPGKTYSPTVTSTMTTPMTTFTPANNQDYPPVSRTPYGAGSY